MALYKLNQKKQITIGVLTLFAGLCMVFSTYLGNKKIQVFDDMNELYYEQLISMEFDVDELEEEPEEEEVIDVPNPGNNTTSKTTTTKKPGGLSSSTTTTKKITQAPIDYTQYYVGYLNIPKINLKKGFTEIDSRHNTVGRNIQIIKPSNYPDVKNGNMIIAAHSGSTSVSFFKDLYKLALDDTMTINYKDKDYKYVIKNIYYVKKVGTVAIRRNVNATTLTLITCTKGDSTTQTVYIAELV